MTAPDPDALRALVAPLVERDPDALAGDDDLVLLGLSSLELMRLVGGWRRDGLPVVLDELASTPTIDAWAEHLAWAARRTDQADVSDDATEKEHP